MRHQSRHLILVSSKVIAETLFEFGIFLPQHQCTRNGGEQSESVADGEPCTDAPSQHLAKVSQVDGMPHARADAAGNQLLFTRMPTEFRNTSQATGGESAP